MPRTPDARPSGRPLPPRPAQTGTSATGTSGKRPDRTQSAPGGSGQGSTPNQVVQPSTSGQGGKSTTLSQGRKSTAPHQSNKPVSTSGSGTPAAPGGPFGPPPGRGGVGDSTWTDWYQMVMRKAGSRIFKPQGPPYLIGTAEARREAIGQIMTKWMEKSHPRTISPLRPCGPTTLGSTHRP